jgi:GTP pyrophosphokinase
VVDEIENMNYKLAGCCHPVPGDAIFGFVTVARGITIHREDCPNASSMKERYPYRVLPARWRDREEKSNFRTDIYIKGADREGVLSEVTKVISSYAGIVSINLKSIGRHFQGKITVMLHDRKQVRALVKKLSQHRDIVDVYRVGDINQNQV